MQSINELNNARRLSVGVSCSVAERKHAVDADAARMLEENDSNSAAAEAAAAAAGVPELSSLLQELRYITRRVRSDEDKENETNDWKFAAMVIDRLCFWLSSVYLLLLTVVFLSVAGS